MTDLIGQDQKGSDAPGAGSVPAAEEGRSAAVGASVKAAVPAQRREVGSPSILRLAMLAVVIVLIGAGAGGLGSLLLPKEYAARAQLQYSLSSAIPNELLRNDRRLETQLVLLRSGIVLGPVASGNGMTAEDLANEVSAQIVEGSEIIEVEVRDRTRERAETLLTGIVAQYLLDANRDSQDPVLAYLESQLSEVQKNLRAPDLLEADALELGQQQKVLIGLRDARESQLSSGHDSLSSGRTARVVVPPYPAGQVSPRPLLAIAAGAATALIVASFVVLLVARRRIRS